MQRRLHLAVEDLPDLMEALARELAPRQPRMIVLSVIRSYEEELPPSNVTSLAPLKSWGNLWRFMAVLVKAPGRALLLNGSFAVTAYVPEEWVDGFSLEQIAALTERALNLHSTLTYRVASQQGSEQVSQLVILAVTSPPPKRPRRLLKHLKLPKPCLPAWVNGPTPSPA